MKQLSLGKIRGLQQLANSDGIFAICAMDHRGSLQKMLNEDNPRAVSYKTMVSYKLDLCRFLAPHCSAVLLDPVYGAAQAIAGGVLPGSTGLLISLESTGYAGSAEARLTRLLPGWGVEKAKRMGAQAVKLLLYYRPDLKDVASKQLELVKGLAEDCLRHDIPFLVEPKTYPVGRTEKNPRNFARVKPELVLETARQLSSLPLDVLKVEFPADLNYEEDEGKALSLCRQLDEASRVPWVVLSAGVDFELFHREVKLACQAGASGFLGGRALWQEAAGMRSLRQRRDFLRKTVVERLRHLSLVATTYGVPWFKKLGLNRHELVPVAENWHQQY